MSFNMIDILQSLKTIPNRCNLTIYNNVLLVRRVSVQHALSWNAVVIGRAKEMLTNEMEITNERVDSSVHSTLYKT